MQTLSKTNKSVSSSRSTHLRPPLPKHPNDTNKALWTDHFLVKAGVR